MSTYEDAKDQYVEIGDVTFAYRRFGASTGVPLVLLIHFRGTMDHWDPAFINPLAAARPIFIMDQAGVGRSGGKVVNDYNDWAQNTIDVLSALGLNHVDLFGFSMGGIAVQMVTLRAPQLVRRLILAGTISSAGAGVELADMAPFEQLKSAVTDQEHNDAFLDTFFHTTEASRAAGLASWNRIKSARKDRVDYLSVDGGNRQAAAFAKSQNPALASRGSYDRFHEIKIPVFIANGSNDVLLPSSNSYLMWKRLVNGEPHLHLFPDSGHGFLYQFADQYTRLINEFLDTPSSRQSRL